MPLVSSVEEGSNSITGASFQNDAALLYPSKASKKRSFKEYILSSLQFRLPAVVKSYDYNTNIAEVLIATKKKTTHRDDEGNFIDVDYPIFRVRVRQPMSNINGGGIGVILPVSEGDSGWIESADKNCEAYFLDPSHIQESSDDFGAFLFQYGSFTPCVWNPDSNLGWKHIAEDEGCISIRNSDGDLRITLNPESKEIKIFAPSKISVNSPLVQMSGDLNVSGDVKAGNISLKKHVHGSVQSGDSNTSTPK